MCRSELKQERVHTSEVRHLSISRKKTCVCDRHGTFAISTAYAPGRIQKTTSLFTYLVLMRAAEGIVESLRLLLHENLVAIMDI